MKEYERIFELIKEAEQLKIIKYNRSYQPLEVIELFKDKIRKKKRLSLEIEKLLNEYVFKYLDDYTLITNEIYDELYNLASKLYSHTVQIDCVFSYNIHETLYKKAIADGDINKIIKEIYHTSLSIYYADSFLFKDKGVEGFARVEEYYPIYNTLDKEARDYLNRSAGNFIMASITLDGEGIEQVFKDAYRLIDFWEEKKKTDQYNLPYDNYIFATYRNLTICLQFIRMGKHCTPYVLENLVKASTYVYEHINTIYKITTLPIVYTCRYAYFASLWHAGKISGDELLEKLKSLCGANPDDPYSSESLWKSLRMRAYYILYTEYVRGKDSEESNKVVKETIEEIKKYLRGYEVSKLHSVIDYEILSCINSLHSRDEEKSDVEKLSYFSVIIDPKALYYDSMNYEISLAILSFLYLNNHELIKDLDYKEMKNFLYVCCHSANCGMQYYTSTFYRFYRKRFIEDQKLIDFHLERGHKLLENNQLSDDCLTVCINHHTDYSKRNELSNKITLAIDLLAFSELINQKTDSYSLLFNNIVSFEKAIKEINENNKEKLSLSFLNVINNNANLQAILKYKVSEGRGKILYDCYKAYFEERDEILKMSIFK